MAVTLPIGIPIAVLHGIKAVANYDSQRWLQPPLPWHVLFGVVPLLTQNLSPLPLNLDKSPGDLLDQETVTQ